MVARARLIKMAESDAKVVFIGPCLAKRAEAKRPELSDAVDLVITYKELSQIFDASNINPSENLGIDMPGFREASRDGRIYAHSGGVTEAISKAVDELKKGIKIVGVKGNGLKECSSILESIESDKIDANFMEGMGCPGGCVGGPRTIIEPLKATELVNEYGEDSLILTPFDNLNVAEILKQFGVQWLGEIAGNEELNGILSRN
jgi:iron only hydrogenase large subunit-like protein